jgi:hypothetical protein
VRAKSFSRSGSDGCNGWRLRRRYQPCCKFMGQVKVSTTSDATAGSQPHPRLSAKSPRRNVDRPRSGSIPPPLGFPDSLSTALRSVPAACSLGQKDRRFTDGYRLIALQPRTLHSKLDPRP